MLGPKGKNFEEDDKTAEQFEEYPEFPVSDVNMKVRVALLEDTLTDIRKGLHHLLPSRKHQ
jgi:hypothetical protein